MSFNLSELIFEGRSEYTGISAGVGCKLHPNGLLGWLMDSNNYRLVEFELTTAWDITTFALTGTIYNFGLSGVYDFQFNSDGTICLVWQTGTSQYHLFELTTAWDIVTLSLIQTQSADDAYATKYFYIKPDGTHLWCSDSYQDKILHYSLSTPWDISTLAYVVGDFSTPDVDSPQGILFESDGLTMHLTTDGGTGIKSYSLSTAWDISTATYRGSAFDFYSADLGSPVTSLFGGPITEVEYLYLYDSSYDEIFQYTIPIFFNFEGVVNEENIPVERIVRLYDRDTGLLIEEVLSSSVDGSFALTKLRENFEYSIIILDNTNTPNYNALIYDRITVSTGS